MAKKAVIYQRVPADRSTVSGIYVLEVQNEKGESVIRAGNSVSNLALSCSNDIDLRGARLGTISSEMIDMDSGDQYLKISLDDLVRFRRAYSGK